MEFILLDGASTGIPLSVTRRSIVGDAIARRFEPRLFSIDKISPWFLKQWLENCEKEHGACRTEHAVNGREATTDIDLIDVKKGCLVKATTAFRYVALSYVNGRFRGLETTRATRERLGEEGALPQEESLSEVVRHAMLFTLLIGEEYLWVDTLCIVQDDPQNKHDQIARMDEIYTSALVTFISLGRGADEGLPWLGDGSPRHIRLHIDANLDYEAPELETAISKVWRKVKNPTSSMKVNILLNPPLTPGHILPFTTYESRGWTCQERLLSTRKVYFSTWQMYAQCRQTLEEEHMNQVTESPDYNPLSHFEPSTPKNEMVNFVQYAQIVANYTRRNLTLKTDILNAFAGISSILERKMASSFRYGLPERVFHQALFWIPSSQVVRRTLEPDSNGVAISHMPSWSWAGWEGQVHHIQNLYSVVRPEEYEFRSELTWIDDGLGPKDQLLRGSSLEAGTLAGRGASILHFEAWTVSGDVFNYLFDEQDEQSLTGHDDDLSASLDHPILMCAIIQPEFLAEEKPGKGKTHREG